MATIYAHTNEGYVVRHAQSTWSDARDNVAGTRAASTAPRFSDAVQASRYAARGGGYTFSIRRSFFYFDTSGISTDVDSATFKVYGFSQGTGDLIAVKATSGIEIISVTDFSNIVGWSTTTDGSGGGDNESNVTKYSAEISTWSTSGYNDITLNAQALADMRDDNTIYICLLNFDYDLKDIAPTSLNSDGMYYIDGFGTLRDPYIDYDLAAVATADNATFFGTNF